VEKTPIPRSPASNPTIALRASDARDLRGVLDLLALVDLPVDGVAEGLGEGYTVVDRAGAIMGGAAIETYGRLGLLRSVAVHPTLQGTGLGGNLVRDRIAWAESQGLDTVYLLTTTAAAYFLRFEFQIIDRDSTPGEIQQSKEFRVICPESAVVMRRSLSRHGATPPSSSAISKTEE
jgi:amino-acid N-acetyltransferase